MKKFIATTVLILCTISVSRIAAQNIRKEQDVARWFKDKTHFPDNMLKQGYTCTVDAKVKIEKSGKLTYIEPEQNTHWAFLSALKVAAMRLPIVDRKRFDRDTIDFSLDFSEILTPYEAKKLKYIERYTPPTLDGEELPYDWIKSVLNEEQRLQLAKIRKRYFTAKIYVSTNGSTKIKYLSLLKNDPLFARFSESNEPWTPATINGEVVASEQYLKFVVDSMVTPAQLIEIIGSPNDMDVDGESMLIAEEMPTFQGGDVTKFKQWVQSKVTYPKEAFINKESGVVIASFVVNTQGDTCDINIIKSPSNSLSQEVIHIIESSPRWIPAKQGGKIVNLKFTIPIVFKLK